MRIIVVTTIRSTLGAGAVAFGWSIRSVDVRSAIKILIGCDCLVDVVVGGLFVIWEWVKS